ncbi:MAG: hypothetical protein UHS51_01800 [Atopobiaceae bacterium]|jgi:hypothetical protein|nr:hypothetical protein [Atopobiaceae bacterium]
MICNTIKYRGYVGTIEISEDDNVIFKAKEEGPARLNYLAGPLPV